MTEDMKCEIMQQKRKMVYLIFGIMTVIQLGMIIYGFQFKKEGIHSDEMWSYGYANSYYQKDIYQENNLELININEWVDGDVLRDYIVVNKGEEFEYGSIYQNQIYDLSPPLHSMILHTICSFFPEQFSLWYSFSINIVAFLICMLFLFKTARMLKDECFALCCCALYGFSLGARDTYVYLRMYAMCTALLMIIVYNLVTYLKKIKAGERIWNRNLLGVCLVSFAGFLTHYYMIAVVGLLTFFTCAVLLFHKRIKAMFVYGLSLLVTLLLSFAVFPSLLHVAQSQSSKVAEQTSEAMNYNFEMRFRIIMNFMTMKLYNIPVSVYKSGMFPIIVACLIVFLILALPVLYLLRDTKIIKQLMKRTSFLIRHCKSILKYLWRRINWVYVVFVLTIICQIILVGETSNVYGMGEFEDRYILYLYPITCLVGVAIINQIGKILLKKKNLCRYILVGITMLLVGINLHNRILYVTYYFPESRSGETIESCVKDRYCIYVMNETWLLTAAVPYLMDAEEFFHVYNKDYDIYEEEYREKLKNGELVLVVDIGFTQSVVDMLENYNDNVSVKSEESSSEKERYEDMLDFFENLEPDTTMEKISQQSIFGRVMDVYLINP